MSNSNILHSSLYNLKELCPNILLYKNSYFELFDNTYIFNEEINLNDYKNLSKDIRLSSFSAYLSFLIISNLFINNVIIKKDIEEYYTAQILSFLKLTNNISFFQLKDLAVSWNSINKTIDFLIKDLENYVSLIPNYKVYWSDFKYNYYDNIPLIAIDKNEEITLYYIIHKDFNNLNLTGELLDCIKIPSILRSIYIINKEFNINSIKVLYIDNSNLNSKFKFVKYKLDKDKINYIDQMGSLENYRNETTNYSNLKYCSQCIYFTECKINNIFYKNTKIKPIKIKHNLKELLTEDIK